VLTCSPGKILSNALILRSYVVTSPRAVASPAEDPTGTLLSLSGGPHQPFLEPIPGLPAVVDNGEELVVNVSVLQGQEAADDAPGVEGGGEEGDAGSALKPLAVCYPERQRCSVRSPQCISPVAPI